MSLATDRVALELVSELSLPTIAVGLREGATADQRLLAFVAAGRAMAQLARIREQLDPVARIREQLGRPCGGAR